MKTDLKNNLTMFNPRSYLKEKVFSLIFLLIHVIVCIPVLYVLLLQLYPLERIDPSTIGALIASVVIIGGTLLTLILMWIAKHLFKKYKHYITFRENLVTMPIMSFMLLIFSVMSFIKALDSLGVSDLNKMNELSNEIIMSLKFNYSLSVIENLTIITFVIGFLMICTLMTSYGGYSSNTKAYNNYQDLVNKTDFYVNKKYQIKEIIYSNIYIIFGAMLTAVMIYVFNNYGEFSIPAFIYYEILLIIFIISIIGQYIKLSLLISKFNVTVAKIESEVGNNKDSENQSIGNLLNVKEFYSNAIKINMFVIYGFSAIYITYLIFNI